MLTRDVVIVASRCVNDTIKIHCENVDVWYIDYVHRVERFWGLRRNEYVDKIANSATGYILNKIPELPATAFNSIKSTVYNMVFAMYVVDDIDEMRATISLSLIGDDDLEEHD